MVQDVHQLRQRMGERFPGLPYFILGHSMGSFLTRTYLIRWPGTVTGAILSGTGQEAGALVAFGSGFRPAVPDQGAGLRQPPGLPAVSGQL